MTNAPYANEQPVATGTWMQNDTAVTWRLFDTRTLPPSEHISMAMGIVLTEGGIVLPYNTKRDTYEVVGGHPEPGETLEEAWLREAGEEAGVTPEGIIAVHGLIAVCEVTSARPIINRETSQPYANPGYMTFNLWQVRQDLLEPTGEEVSHYRIFPLDNLPPLHPLNKAAIALGTAAYQRTQQGTR